MPNGVDEVRSDGDPRLSGTLRGRTELVGSVRFRSPRSLSLTISLVCSGPGLVRNGMASKIGLGKRFSLPYGYVRLKKGVRGFTPAIGGVGGYPHNKERGPRFC